MLVALSLIVANVLDITKKCVSYQQNCSFKSSHQIDSIFPRHYLWLCSRQEKKEILQAKQNIQFYFHRLLLNNWPAEKQMTVLEF